MLNGRAAYVSNPAKASGGKKFADKDIIFAFAENALRNLCDAIPGTISKMLVRVDVMCLNDGRLVVNEFESFEAAYWGSHERELETSAFLIKFWEITIADVAFKFKHG
jgi:hypothetical protein